VFAVLELLCAALVDADALLLALTDAFAEASVLREALALM
jgi:hypothetical protein